MIAHEKEYSLLELQNMLIVRDLSQQFFSLRSTLNPQGGVFMESDDDQKEPLVGDDASNRRKTHISSEMIDLESGEMDRGLQYVEEPKWKKILDEVRNDLNDIDEKINELRIKHQNHTVHTTGKLLEEKQREKTEIEADTHEIQRLFKIVKQNINEIENSISEKEKRKRPQQFQMLKNLKVKLVTELSELYRRFRETQRDYLSDLSTLKTKRKELSSMDDDQEDDEERRRLEELYDKLDRSGSNFSEEQVRQIMVREKRIIRQDQELKNILKSILELQELFEDFETMVIEQGTLLDRIDRHIEQTQINVRKGNKHIKKAEKYQKCNRWLICLMFLLVAVLVVVIGLAIKFGIKLYEWSSPAG